MAWCRTAAMTVLAVLAATNAEAQPSSPAPSEPARTPPAPPVLGAPAPPLSRLRQPPTLMVPPREVPPPMHVSKATTRTSSFGGAGGGDFFSPCGGRSLMTGIRARAGSWIDALAPICTEYDPVRRTLTGAPRTGSTNGGSGGGPTQITCLPPRGVVVKIEATQADNRDGSVGVIVVSCGDHLDPTRPVGLAPESSASFGQSRRGAAFQMSCPPPFVAGGIFGKSGKFIDRIGLMCVHYKYGTTR